VNLAANFHAVVPIVAGVGNALMAVPMVRQLKTRAGAGRITVIAQIEAMAESFRRMPEVDEVIVTGGGGLKNQLRGVKESRRRRPDLFVVPFPSNRWQYSMLAACSGAKRAVLHDYPVGRFRAMHFVGTRLPATRGIHDVIQNLNLLRLFGVEPDLSDRPTFPLHDEDRDRAGELLKSIGLHDDEPFIAIQAGSARTILAQAKRWPTANYAKLVSTIRRELDLKVALLEGPDESGVADEIVSHVTEPGAHPCIAKLRGNLGTAAAILARAALYAGSDSGLAHLAAAVGTRPVTIFAPADPDRVCPYGYRDLVVKPNKSCSPCFLYPWHATRPKMCCGQHGEPMCITEVTVEQVMNVIRRETATLSLYSGRGRGRG
jgi:ADP-heptose:LPS heptosyltransferase